jgi:hypothetical protein
MEYKAVIDRLKIGLKDKGMLIYDAFRAINSSNSGLLSCSELYGGIDYFGIPFSADQVYELMKRISVKTYGLISYEEFKAAFHSAEDELESRGVVDLLGMSDSNSNFEQIPPKVIPELAQKASKGGDDEEEAVVLSGDLLQNFKVKVNPVGNFETVWTSQNANCKTQISVWSPSMQTSMLQSNKTRMCIGHYAVVGFSPPAQPRIGNARYLLIEVTDMNQLRLSKSKVTTAVLASVFPHPLRFKQVWQLQRGDKSIYAWKAIAPEGFVAMGMICTCTDEPPNETSMRCIPKAWCVPTKVKPTKIWDDTGAGGGKPGSIWTVNSMDMIAVVPGHEAPKDEFYLFRDHRFFMDEKCRTVKGVVT